MKRFAAELNSTETTKEGRRRIDKQSTVHFLTLTTQFLDPLLKQTSINKITFSRFAQQLQHDESIYRRAVHDQEIAEIRLHHFENVLRTAETDFFSSDDEGEDLERINQLRQQKNAALATWRAANEHYKSLHKSIIKLLEDFRKWRDATIKSLTEMVETMVAYAEAMEIEKNFEPKAQNALKNKMKNVVNFFTLIKNYPIPSMFN